MHAHGSTGKVGACTQTASLHERHLYWRLLKLLFGPPSHLRESSPPLEEYPESEGESEGVRARVRARVRVGHKQLES